jgi:hypothetical protein
MALPLGFMGSSKNAKHHGFGDPKSTVEAWLDPGLRGLDEQFFDVALLPYFLLCPPGLAVRRIRRQLGPGDLRGF